MTGDGRRYAREAAARARWLADQSRGGSAGGPAAAVAPPGRDSPSPARPWKPTLAEATFMTAREVKAVWTEALRGASEARWPLQTVELGHAAYLAAYLVSAGRIAEDRATEHLLAAAARAGVERAEATAAMERGWSLGAVHAAEEVEHGGLPAHPPGAFTAVAAATRRYDRGGEYWIDPASLDPLPVAVLVHAGHPPEGRLKPVAVAVPTASDGAVHVEAVFASARFGDPAGDTWTLVRTGRLRAVSIFAAENEFHRGPNGYLSRGTLLAVDLVRSPADKAARVTSVVEARALTPGQRRTQELLDRYLADARNPRFVNMLHAAELRGAAALEALVPVVAPLRAERGLLGKGEQWPPT